MQIKDFSQHENSKSTVHKFIWGQMHIDKTSAHQVDWKRIASIISINNE